jgi:hypothetical protein
LVNGKIVNGKSLTSGGFGGSAWLGYAHQSSLVTLSEVEGHPPSAAADLSENGN